jgi:hypothetical protein
MAEMADFCRAGIRLTFPGEPKYYLTYSYGQ